MSETPPLTEPEVTAEFRARLEPVGLMMNASGPMLTWRHGVGVATLAGSGLANGTALVGFGPPGETLLLPCRPDDVIVDGNHAWGYTRAGEAEALGLWARDGSARDPLRELGLHSRGPGRLTVAGSWAAWYTAEVRKRLVLFNADTGAAHFISQQPGDLGLDWSPPCLWTEGDEAQAAYRVFEAPGRTRFEVYATASGRSTPLPLDAVLVLKAGNRLIWRDARQTLHSAPWPALAPQRVLGAAAESERTDGIRLVWKSQGACLVDDGEASTVIASAAEGAILLSAAGGHVLLRIGDALMLWSPARGREVVSTRPLPGVAHLTGDALYLGTPGAPPWRHLGAGRPLGTGTFTRLEPVDSGPRMSIHRVPLSPARSAHAVPRDAAHTVRLAQALSPRELPPHVLRRGADLVPSEGTIDISRLCARLARFLSERCPAAEPGTLRPSASEAQLASVEAEIGARLPEDVRALYRHHDGVDVTRTGSGIPPWLLPFCDWCSLDELLSHWQMCGSITVDASEPAAASYPWRSCTYLPTWIPVGRSNTSEAVFIDLDPGPAGTRGQLFRYSWDSEPSLLATSLPTYLDRLLCCVEQGLIDIEDGQWCDPHTREWVARLP